ncbi:DUF4902 domain-containing protein [Burkholderia sp. Bp9002]|nr:DUF4902 domain-containing protein [Burkholderia sp. Bp9125]RQS12416.1 DUF4902 domain-containing protein [Burkholderia sp. Bp9002]
MDLKSDAGATPARLGASAPHDGYVRLSVSQLAAVNPGLLYAGCDAQVLNDAWDHGMPACHAGYCEWIDTDWRPPITFGWCWLADRHHVYRMLPNSVTANVMIVCAKGYDLGPEHTMRLLEEWIVTLPWSASIHAYVPLTDL